MGLRVFGSVGGDAVRVGDVERVWVRREVGCLVVGGRGEAERGRDGVAGADEVAYGGFELGVWGHVVEFRLVGVGRQVVIFCECRV